MLRRNVESFSRGYDLKWFEPCFVWWLLLKFIANSKNGGQIMLLQTNVLERLRASVRLLIGQLCWRILSVIAEADCGAVAQLGARNADVLESVVPSLEAPTHSS